MKSLSWKMSLHFSPSKERDLKACSEPRRRPSRHSRISSTGKPATEMITLRESKLRALQNSRARSWYSLSSPLSSCLFFPVVHLWDGFAEWSGFDTGYLSLPAIFAYMISISLAVTLIALLKAFSRNLWQRVEAWFRIILCSFMRFWPFLRPRRRENVQWNLEPNSWIDTDWADEHVWWGVTVFCTGICLFQTPISLSI